MGLAFYVARVVSIDCISVMSLRLRRERLFCGELIGIRWVLSASAVYRDVNTYIRVRWEVARSMYGGTVREAGCFYNLYARAYLKYRHFYILNRASLVATI